MNIAYKPSKSVIFALIPVVVIMTIICGLFLLYELKPLIFKTYIGNILKSSVLEKSTADIMIDDTKVRMEFSIARGDIDVLNRFNKKLGVSDKWLDGLSFNIDKETAQRLSSSLPTMVVLKFDDKGLTFSNETIGLIAPSFNKKNFAYATGSATLTLLSNNDTDYNLKVEDPGVLVRESTPSGTFYLSNRLSNFVPLLDKISTFDIKVSGKNISGYLQLK